MKLKLALLATLLPFASMAMDFNPSPVNSKIVQQVVSDDELLFTRNNFVNLRGIINGQSVSQAIVDLSANKSPEPILFIHSGGGSVAAGMRLVQFIQDSPRKIRCYASFAASMAFVIFQACHERNVGSASYLMQHQSSGSVEGNLEQAKAELKDMWIGMIDILESAQAKRLKLTVPEFKAKIQNDWHIVGSETIMKNHAADRVRRIQCEMDIASDVYNQKLSVMGYDVFIKYSVCPLATAPLSVDFSRMDYRSETPPKNSMEDVQRLIKKYSGDTQ